MTYFKQIGISPENTKYWPNVGLMLGQRGESWLGLKEQTRANTCHIYACIYILVKWRKLKSFTPSQTLCKPSKMKRFKNGGSRNEGVPADSSCIRGLVDIHSARRISSDWVVTGSSSTRHEVLTRFYSLRFGIHGRWVDISFDEKISGILFYVKKYYLVNINKYIPSPLQKNVRYFILC